MDRLSCSRSRLGSILRRAWIIISKCDWCVLLGRQVYWLQLWRSSYSSRFAPLHCTGNHVGSISTLTIYKNNTSFYNPITRMCRLPIQRYCCTFFFSYIYNHSIHLTLESEGFYVSIVQGLYVSMLLCTSIISLAY